MFTVAKQDIPTHWWVCGGLIEERFGDRPDNEDYVSTRAEAEQRAQVLQKQWLLKTLEYEKGRVRGLALLIYRIRSLWNPVLRQSLRKHFDKVEQARIAAESTPEIIVRSLPDMIPVKGTRIPIGTTVYEVDTYALTLRESKVVSETIHYYGFSADGGKAVYTLENGRWLYSTLNSGFSNIRHFLDHEQAVECLRPVLDAKLAELQEQSKTL